jgi:3-isopropylmalate/(R)-2-methylmalate dehydratase small subunit
MKVQGKVFKYGNNVDTDVIIPARYLNVSDGYELSKYCMIDLDPEFIKNINNGDVIVAGNNFGCGSSREHAPLAIKCAGISCVIASTFARIFYRNAINIGMPILECDEAAKDINNNDIIEIDFDTGIISNKTKNKTYQAQPFPDFIKEIINSNGLVNMTKNKIQGENHE